MVDTVLVRVKVAKPNQNHTSNENVFVFIKEDIWLVEHQSHNLYRVVSLTYNAAISKDWEWSFTELKFLHGGRRRLTRADELMSQQFFIASLGSLYSETKR